MEPNVNGLMFKHRKAHVALTCLATETRPHYVNFETHGIKLDDDNKGMSGIVQEKSPTSVEYQCIPLYTMLLALGNPTVNWFILDVEGAEFPVCIKFFQPI